MKKSIMSGSIRYSILLAGILGIAQAAPYGPEGRETRWTQPTGATIQLRVFGDEYYARTETSDGYTVILGNDKTYYYATLSQDGSSLVPSATRADAPAPADLAKHLDLPKGVVGQVRQLNHKKYDGDRDERWNERVTAVRSLRDGVGAGRLSKAATQIKAAPFVGKKRGLTILAQFPNDPATPASDGIKFPTTRDKIVRYCNGVNYKEDGNTGSVRDFFSDQSLGKLTYTQTVTQIVTLPRPREYYNFSDYPANTQYREDAGRELLKDALEVLKDANFDFTSLSLDEEGKAYATNIFFAGPDSGVWSQGLWPHQWNLEEEVNVGTVADPIYIFNYQITNIDNSTPVIGTFCHENGHLILDYPDLYDYGGESEGAGDHCLMGGGNYNNGGKTPSPINAYFKDIAGWGNVTDITPADFKTVNLQTTGNRAHRIRKPGVPTEYFIVENRGKGDKWAEYSVDKGIAIWHIDETVSGNNNEAMTADAHYQVSLEQADGFFDLEAGANRGDSSDLFDTGSPRFNDGTLPDATWWDGTPSSVRVEVLSGIGASTSVLFGAVPPNTILLDNPNGGEVIFPASRYDIGWRANITGNVRIELHKAGAFHSTIAANELNDGKYTWQVPASLAKGTNYTVLIRSLTNIVPTSDLSEAAFSISDATFPAEGVMPYGWFKPASAHTGWTVSKSRAYEGTRCLVSKPVPDGKSAGIAYRSNFNAGNVSFYMKISSEVGFDHGRFYIDGVMKPLAGKKGITGSSNWLYFTFPVTAGTHTFLWTYEKDDSYSELKDTAWLDGVSLPTTTQEISVQKPAGVEHEDGKTTDRFPDTTVGSTSGSHTFTIRNRGKAELTGLQIGMTGANKGDFVVKGPSKKKLAPGASTTFQVRFAPKAAGARKAGIRIRSNDVNEGNFVINFEGNGVGLPQIAVSQPAANKLADDVGVRSFGFAKVGTTGQSRTFTIRNSGEAVLNGLHISKTGLGREDFRVDAPAVTSLAPGASTTFKVTFSPSVKNERRAAIHIASNDKNTGVFDINVVGTGAPKTKSAALAASARSDAGGIVEAVFGNRSDAGTTTVEVVGGQKYLSLTVTKTAGSDPGTVEVSSNLLDWYSGKKHTTVLVDDATTLKVRDNTPVTPEAKRHIRLK